MATHEAPQPLPFNASLLLELIERVEADDYQRFGPWPWPSELDDSDWYRLYSAVFAVYCMLQKCYGHLRIEQHSSSLEMTFDLDDNGDLTVSTFPQCLGTPEVRKRSEERAERLPQQVAESIEGQRQERVADLTFLLRAAHRAVTEHPADYDDAALALIARMSGMVRNLEQMRPEPRKGGVVLSGSPVTQRLDAHHAEGA